MRRKSGVKKSAAQFKLKNLLSPGVSISVMSIVVYFMNIPFPQDIRAVVSSVGGITTPRNDFNRSDAGDDGTEIDFQRLACLFLFTGETGVCASAVVASTEAVYLR